VLFYLMTVFTLSWGTSQLHYTRTEFLLLQMIGMLAFGLMIPLSAVIADRRGRRAMLIAASAAILVSAWCSRRCSRPAAR
jgi:MFS family permease